MSICAFWIIALTQSNKHQGQSNQKIIFSRHYPTVKKRAKKSCQLQATLPSDEEIVEAILSEMQVHRGNDRFIQEYDSCAIPKQTPMLAILEGKIWPIVAIIKRGFLFACLPCVENVPKESAKSLNTGYQNTGAVSIAYSLMQKIADLVGSPQPGIGIPEDKIQELRDYLLVCMPFGTPMEMEPATVRGILASRDSVMPQKQKVPAWRPSSHKGKQNITIFIQEHVRCIQYDRSSMPDVCEVYGTVYCKGDLEGAPEVSLDLIASSEADVLNNMVYHNCVQLSNNLAPTMNTDDKAAPNSGVKSLRFCPPLENFPLCHYKLPSAIDSAPIMAYYQMQAEDNFVKIKILLKLWKSMKNNFDDLQVHIPFFNRRPVTRIDFSPPSHNVILLKDLRTVRWSLASKFPSKTMELSLQGQVNFSDGDEPVTLEDKFCVGLNSYIQIFFKVADFTYSGLKVDNRSIKLYPSTKLKTNIGAELSTGEFKVWNSLGDAMGYGKM